MNKRCGKLFHPLPSFLRRDMEEADRKRREEFKTYEMEKKFEQNERLNHIEDEEKRKEEENRMKKAVRASVL